MVDNQHNYYHTAPDKGKQHGPVWAYSGSLDGYLTNLRSGVVLRGGYAGSNSRSSSSIRQTKFPPAGDISGKKRQSSSPSDFWLASLGPLGAQPHAGGDGYQFFRNVVDDFGADNTGDSDATEALNAASASWSKHSVGRSRERCGKDCGNTFSQGAIVFFPGGTYKICTPVIQYYYTQFVGDPNDMPVIKGCDKFQGIALFDVDPYKPGESGAQWYVNQNLVFNQCNTAVQMVWDWGWTWQQITVNGGSIGFDISGVGGDAGQGTGSVSIIDSTISDVEVGVLTNNLPTSPNVVLDNTRFEKVASPVRAEGGSDLLSGNSDLWATGRRYNGSEGSMETGAITAPGRGEGLNDADGKLYVRSRPQYEGQPAPISTSASVPSSATRPIASPPRSSSA